MRDRVAPQAARIVLEPIFEADFLPCSDGFRPKRSATQAMERLRTGFIKGSQFVAEFELPDSKTIRHLRSILVATGALPPRDEHMIRLEHWITAIIAGRDDPGERQLLHRYARGPMAPRHRLLHDDTLKPGNRVAGLLVLLYAQRPAAISRLTLDHVHADEQHVQLRLGREPVLLPEPLGALVLQLAASCRGHAALGDHGSSRWLFPGGQPGQPISAYRLAVLGY